MVAPLVVAGIGAALGAAAQGVSAAVGAANARGDREAAMEILRRSAAEFNVPLPVLEQVVAEQLAGTEMGEVRARPELEAQQQAILNGLQRMAEEGFSPVEAAAVNQLGNEVGQRARGQREAIENQMAARGQLGSGMEYALKAQAAQDAAQSLNQGSQNAAAQIWQRRLSAMGQAGNMAGSLRSQETSEAARRAAARDELQRYNTAARQQARYYGAGLAQQQYDNQLKRAAGRAGQAQALAGSLDASADRAMRGAIGVGQAIGQGAMGVADAYLRDEYGRKWGGGK